MGFLVNKKGCTRPQGADLEFTPLDNPTDVDSARMSFTTGSQLPLTVRESYLIANEWAIRKADRLYKYLSNGGKKYVLGWRDNSGQIVYRRGKTKSIETATSWALSTVFKKERTKVPITIAFYSNNENGQSRWGGFDFDAHASDEASRHRAYCWSSLAVRHLLNVPGLHVIWEQSGRGWHCWAIAKDFWPVEKWVVLLKQIAAKIGAPIGEGQCEIFPPDTIRSVFGRALRAPGSWNPATGDFSAIAYENIDDLLETYFESERLSYNHHEGRLSDNDLGLRLHDKREKVFSICRVEWSDWDIVQARSRHLKLEQLVGRAFWYLGKAPARVLAEWQYERNKELCCTSLEEHLKEFDSLWLGMTDNFRSALQTNVATVFNQLATDSQREVFKILRSFASNAEKDGERNFAISVENVGLRVGLTFQAIAKMRKKFEKAGIIRKTQQHQRNVRAARFVWLLEEYL